MARVALALAWIAAFGLPVRGAGADTAGDVIVIRGTEVSSAPADIGKRVQAGPAGVEVIRPEPTPVQAAPPSRGREPERQLVVVYLPGYEWDDVDAGFAWEPWPWTTRWHGFRHRPHFRPDKVHHFRHAHHPHAFIHPGHARFATGFGSFPKHGAAMRAPGRGFGR